ncbi:MAG: hypothetical protein RML95_14575 [Anaerolineae bacterium]|nr:hypothetical protein [Anaerolineae bacterium]
MLQPQTHTAAYWTTNLKVTRADVEALFAHFLEIERPLTAREVALFFIKQRLTAESERFRKQLANVTLFQPAKHYEIGQELIFPALNFASGKVVGIREGNNPDYGQFSVIEVAFGERRREFAADLRVPHVLNEVTHDLNALLDTVQPSPEAIFEQYGEAIIEALEARLVDEPEAIYMGGYWFVRSLLAQASVAHLHLAEAVLDLREGGPATAEELLPDLDFAPELPLPLRAFSLNVALSQDERFDNVGADGDVRWFLRRLEPPEVLEIPPRLEYQPLVYNEELLTPELRQLEIELGDEFSELPPLPKPPREVHIRLIYPHRRTGTLPMNSYLESMLPQATEAQRLLITLIDGQTEERFSAWVVRNGRYLCGLNDFYRRHKLPIGAHLIFRATAHPSQFVIDFKAHRPRTEYIRLAIPSGGRLRFENFKRSIGAEYDELMILGAEDIEGVDEVWNITRNRRRSLSDILSDLLPELARLMPQQTVHAKTLYSAVNIMRRCPPGPIFATLLSRSEFEFVGNGYWRMASSGAQS